jgi:hypothetical protein
MFLRGAGGGGWFIDVENYISIEMHDFIDDYYLFWITVWKYASIDDKNEYITKQLLSCSDVDKDKKIYNT